MRRTEKHCNGTWTGLAIEQTLMWFIKSQSGLNQVKSMTENVRQTLSWKDS